MGVPLKPMFASAVLLILLLSGCASQQRGEGQAEQLNETGRVPFPSKTVITQVLPDRANKTKPPVYEGETERGCNVSLRPSEIYAGQFVEFGFSLYTYVDTEFTFNCGDEELRISTGGSLKGIKMCRFSQPGTTLVWMKANGEQCDAKNLTVKPAVSDPRTCYMDSMQYLPNYTYNATVHFTGFGENDDFVWFCDSITKRKPIKRDISTQKLPDSLTISCEFGSKPQKDEIEAFIGPIRCGGMPTRQ